MKKLTFFAGILLALLLLQIAAVAQTVVYTHSFTGTGTSVTGGTPAAAFGNTTGTRSGVQLGGTNPFSGTAYTANTLVEWTAGPPGTVSLGIVPNNGFAQTSALLAPYAAPFVNTLGLNTGLITWTFNMKTSVAASGYSVGTDNAVVVLAGTSTAIGTTGNGYAVAFNPGTPARIRLFRYTGGIAGATTTVILSSTTMANATDFMSVRVTYDPVTNQWNLYTRNDGTAAFANPYTGVTTLAGTAIDNVYTATPMAGFGFYSNHVGYTINALFISLVTAEYSYFDNYTVTISGCALPAIGGTMQVCQGSTTTLTHPTAGGAWSSPSVNVSVAAATGVVTGVTAGTASVIYTVGTCTVGATVTVNPLPSPISGTLTVCTGSATSLTAGPGGGTWASGNAPVATVGGTGSVLGVSPGTAVISYTLPTGCYSTAVVTVVATPVSIGGPSFAVCEGATTALTSGPAGGTWSSFVPSVGTVSASGVVTGIAAGTTTITYDMGSGCYRTAVVTVNPNPTAITGPLTVCAGSTASYSGTPSGGTWFCGCAGVATITPGGTLTGVGAGTCTITYSMPATGCYTTAVVTVVPSPAPISGPANICLGFPTTTYLDVTPGGTWGTTNGNIAIGSTTGIATGMAVGSSVITYALSPLCFSAITVNVLPPAPAPTGTNTVCAGATTTLSHATTGGIWSCACPGIATVTAGGGVVTGVGAGTCIVTYTLPSGCIATTTVTVHPNPPNITGILSVCQGATTALGNSTPSGTWSSSPAAIGTINTSGVFTGVAAGTSTVSYILPTGCYNTATATVNAIPPAIVGTFTVCAGSTTAVSCGAPVPPIVIWSITPPAVASISGTGVITGLSSGTATVTAAIPSGCYTTATITVLDTPSHISGPLGVCAGATTTLTATPVAGTWASSAPAIGSVLSTGTVAGTARAIIGGNTAGTTNIVYTIPNGCTSSATVTVHALPAAIGGTLTTCVGLCTPLSNSSAGGTWMSGNTAVGTINATTGLFCGIAAGTAGVTYSLGTGCTTYTVVTVNPLPAPVLVAGGGPAVVCEGSCITLSSSPAPGTWSSSNMGVGTVNTTGVVCGVSAGTTEISYVLPTGCQRTQVVTVNGLPSAISGAAAICADQCATLTATPAGGTWSSTNPANGSINAATGVYCGNVAITAAGTSTVSYVLPTGCQRTTVLLINPLPSGVSPAAPEVCAGSCTTIAGIPAGGIWSGGAPGIATVTAAGSFCGLAAGTATLVYTLPTSCALSVVGTVNALPAAIGGTLTVCVNNTTTLNSSPAGGTWSSPSGNVTVNASTGEVTGISGGTAVVSYTISTGCRMTTVVTVHALPAVITATPSFGVCVGLTTTLSSTPGGTWSIFNPLVAGISAGGVVTGGSSTGADTTLVTYTNGNGCVRNAVVTVYALPTAITGTTAVCVNFTTTLSSTPAGGTWSSSLPSVGSVDAGTGVVTGRSGPLTTTITYTLPSSGCIATQAVTVYPLPAGLTGPSRVCELQTIILSSPGTPGGTWSSSNTGIATVDGGGTVTGVLGTPVISSATVTYTLGTGCYTTKAVTVDPIPTSITGTLQVCEAYGSTTLVGTPAGGTWSSSNTAVASINAATGVLTAGNNGTATITYRLTATGCYRTEVVTVNQLPTAFTGPAAVCRLETITLGSTPAGGTWSSPDATVAVNAASGDVTGVNAGTAIISYANSTTGCVRTGIITVNALPVAITGTQEVCQGHTTALTNASGGGSWSASNPSVGTIDAGGVFTGINGLPAPATSTVSYTFISTGCRITAVVTVNRLPAPIVGSSGFCNFTTATYSSSPAGGTWSSANTAIIDFPNPATGDADALAVGTSTITYTLGTGCIATKDVFTIFAPYPITGADDVCVGDTTTVADTIAGGVWAITGGGLIASITPATPTTAIVGGLSAGTVEVSYILSTGCYSLKTMTVNPIPAGITSSTGTFAVCEGLLIDLDNTTPGGTWVSADPGAATADTFSGIVTGVNGGAAGRTSVVTYALGTGCNAQVEVTVNPLPAVITGTFEVCEGLTTTLASGPAGGTWASADAAVGTVDAATGIVTGLSAGAMGVNGIGQTVITYTLPTTCIRTQGLTVNPLPSNISGVSSICVGDMTVLGNGTPGGTWSSSNTGVAQVGAASGIVTGISGGNVIITYMLGTGCIKTWPMTVNDNPTPIGGSLQVCAAFATNLTSGPAGGVWSQLSSSTVYGTINTVTGVVSGISGGLVPVTYTLGSGCRTTAVVTVITLPPVISGTPNLCEAGGTTTMLHSVPGGTWSISNPSLATIDATTGVVTGIMAGTAVVTYTVGTGCFNVHTITVNPLPAIITGPSPLEVCVGSQITLASATPGGAWISDATDKATIGTSTGVLTGVGAGIAPIRYHISATGCERSVTVTVNPTPAAITGNPHICMGSAVWYTSASMGGVWSISNPSIATLLATTTNVVTALPVSLGVATITYQFPVTGCRALKSVTVQPLPVVYNVTGGGSYCAGGNGVHIGLSNSQTGVSYVLYRGSVAAGYLAGTGFPLDFGLLTVGGTYTVMATNAVSGCERAMAGSAVVTVITPVTPTVTLNATPADSLCPGETVTMIPVTTTGGTAPTYVWKVNGVTVSTGSTYAFVPADGDVASVTMTSNAGCLATTTATASRTITVMPDALPVANVLAGPNDSLCEFAPVTLTAAPMYGGSSPAFSWFVNGIFKGSGASYTYVPANGDLARVTMVSNYRCRLANTVTSPDVQLYVEPMVVPHVSIIPEPGTTVHAGKPVKLRAVATDAGSNPLYQWKVNGYPIAGATADTFVYIFNDYDSITCMVTSSGICGNIGTHKWVFITTTTGLPGASSLPHSIRLHPNPNRGTFTVRGTLAGSQAADVKMDITNMLGQVVYSGVVKASQGSIDAQVVMDHSLANGMYILTLHLEDGRQTFHFVMEQ